jgi:hypothetical protein
MLRKVVQHMGVFVEVVIQAHITSARACRSGNGDVTVHDVLWRFAMSIYMPRMLDGPFVFVIRVTNKRLVDLLDAIMPTENAVAPCQQICLLSTRSIQTYHSSATSPSSSLIAFSLFAPVLNPRLTSFCKSLMCLFFPNPDPSRTFLPKQSL